MDGCRHCVRTKPWDDAQLAQALQHLLHLHAWTEAPAAMAHARLQQCAACALNDPPGTCRVCGCLLVIRTRICEQHCPHPQGARW